jgi:hypothetical protein
VNPEELPDVLAIALDVANRLESARIPYVVGGSLASSVHGEPRSTMDVDVVADLSEETTAWLIASPGTVAIREHILCIIAERADTVCL